MIPIKIACYDDGVGTESAQWLALPGLAFGYGLKRNVLDLYTFLCRNYQPGDRIYCFGFSRGAFTARVLAALICNQGLVQASSEAEYQRLAKAAFRTYRERYHVARNPFNPFNLVGAIVRWLLRKVRQPYDHKQNHRTNVAFVGVFDTVAAYGLPIDELTRAWEWIFPLSFPNNTLSDHIDNARHALALDDERHSFHPELWTEKEEKDPKPKQPGKQRQLANKINKILPGLFPTEEDIGKLSIHYGEKKGEVKPVSERLLQVWFAGMHSDVGGSYPDDAMSFVPLEWMLKEAESAGLRFKTQEKNNIQAAANLRGPIHDSRAGSGGFYRYRPRKLYHLINDTERDIQIKSPKIHRSVFERMKDGTDGYAPIVLPQNYEVYPSGQAEHYSQAEHRLHQHEAAWDLVWKKRVVYFLTVLTGFAFLLFPVPLPSTNVCEGVTCGLAPLVHTIGLIVPSLLNTWVKAYESHPDWFFLLVAVMVTLTKLGALYQRRIFDVSHAIWKPILATPGAVITSPAGKPEGRLFRFRTDERYLPLLKIFRDKFLVPVVGLVTAATFLLIGSRILFSMFETAGCVCQRPESQAISPQFDNKSLCWGSGYEVEEGLRYRLTLSKSSNPKWEDKTIKSDIGGFELKGKSWDTQVKFLSVTLLRRDLDGKWFQPIARIGESGNDEYLLTPQASADPDKLVAEIVARRSGNLYLYLNDVTLPLPEKWQWSYKNNIGKGDFTLDLINDDGCTKVCTPVAKASPSAPSEQPR